MQLTHAPTTPDTRTVCLVVIPMLLIVAIAYRYYIHIPPTSVPSDFHGLLGRAFMAGQTYLEITPSPQLLALPDPYDPEINKPYVLWDSSLYRGKYYLYFGPVPALFVWVPVKWITGIALSDPELVLGFSIAGTACLTWLLVCISAREQIAIRWGLAFAILAISFGTWLPFMLRRPSFYEVAVSGAYCFSALGLLLLWHGLKPGAQRAPCWLTLASLSFGLAVGCRPVHVFNVAILMMACVTLWRRQGQPAALRALLRIFGPWVLCMAGLMAYNYVRFGSLFETGANYLLTVVNVHRPDFHILRWERVIPNAYFYLFRALTWKNDLTFPFFHVDYYTKLLLPMNMVAETYEPVYGLMANSPFCLFVLAAPYCWAKHCRPVPETREILTGIAVYGGLLFCFLLFYFYTTARYSVDFSPWVMFLASVQYLRLLSTAQTQKGYYWLLLTSGGIAAVYSAFTGTMSGYCGQYLCQPT